MAPRFSTADCVAPFPAADLEPLSKPQPIARAVPVWMWASLAALLSGGLMAACYWPIDAHALAWFALVPWLVVLPRLSSPSAGIFGMLLGLVFFRISLGWLFQIHGLLGGITIFVLSAWMGLAFRIARMLMTRFSLSAMLWAVPLVVVGQEILRCEGLPRMRFPFAAWGYSQAHNLWIAQTASLGGVYFVTFLIVLVNAAIAWAILQKRRRAWIVPAGICAAVGGLGLLAQPRQHAASQEIWAACVQAETTSMRRHLELAQTALESPRRPRLIVLPEHTISDYADATHPFVIRLGALAREHQAFICIGAHTASAAGSKCDYNNVAMLIGPQGRIVNEQAKHVPLPFFNDGEPGATQTVTASEHGIIGTYVCYDGLFTDVPRRIVDRGAELLLVPLMDPARWPARERWQHADMAIFRSIELRRCAVRANTSGISQVVDATGRVSARRTEEDGAGVILGLVHPHSERTVFVRGGYLFATTLGITYLLILLLLTLTEWTRSISHCLRSTLCGMRCGL